uniref:IPPc domain-containing protein n=1 Tax=Rhodnius prolixus TaxID=13249 RepID=T1HW12_RHOPR
MVDTDRSRGVKEAGTGCSVNTVVDLIHIATWNVNGRKPACITKLLGQNSDKYESLPDMVIVGLQEVTMSAAKAISNYLTGERWSETMEDNLSGNYKKVESVSLLGIVLNVFVKLNSAWALESEAVEREMTGMAGLYGNKGGVIMKFQLHGLSFCIVNAHFHAHDKGLEYRIKDFRELKYYKSMQKKYNVPFDKTKLDAVSRDTGVQKNGYTQRK